MGQRRKDATLVERLQVLWAERNPSLYYSLRKYFFAAAVCVSPRLDSLGGGKRGNGCKWDEWKRKNISKLKRMLYLPLHSRYFLRSLSNDSSLKIKYYSRFILYIYISRVSRKNCTREKWNLSVGIFKIHSPRLRKL